MFASSLNECKFSLISLVAVIVNKKTAIATVDELEIKRKYMQSLNIELKQPIKIQLDHSSITNTYYFLCVKEMFDQ